MPTTQEVAEAKKKYLDMQAALEAESKKAEAEPEKPPEQSEREKILEAQIMELKEKNTKKESFFSKMLNLLNSENKQEVTEEPQKEDKDQSGYVTKKEYLSMKEQFHAMQMERDMDDLGVPKDKESREYFVFLMQKQGDKDLSDDEIAKIVEKVKSLSEKKEVKKAEKEPEEEPEEPEEEPEEPEEEPEEPINIRYAKPKGTGSKIKGQKSQVKVNPEEQKSLEQFRNMGSGQRAAFKQKNPELYERYHKMDMEADFWQERSIGEPFFESPRKSILG